LPLISGLVSADEQEGVFSVQLERLRPALNTAATCRLQHEHISPFDHEMLPLLEHVEVLSCELENHKVSGLYGHADRVYFFLEFFAEKFHLPIRIWQGRLVSS